MMIPKDDDHFDVRSLPAWEQVWRTMNKRSRKDVTKFWNWYWGSIRDGKTRDEVAGEAIMLALETIDDKS